MEISVHKFLALTALLASGSVLGSGCVVVDSDEGDTGGARSDTGGDAGEPSTAAGAGGASAGTGSVQAGAPAAGSPPTSAGTGSAGRPPVTAGAAGASAGSAGAPSAGGSSAGAGGALTAGSAGAPTGGGAGPEGGAAGTPACVAGDPAGEGLGPDCSTLLPYASDVCPGADGYTVPPRGLITCINHAESVRSGSLDVLITCLAAIDSGDAGECGVEHDAAVDACVAGMYQATCAAPGAATVCASIQASCVHVDAAVCAAKLKVLGDAEVALIPDCIAVREAPELACDDAFADCAYPADVARPTPAEGCARIIAGCAGVDSAACELALDPASEGGGSLSMLAACIAVNTTETMTCVEAFAYCTT